MKHTVDKRIYPHQAVLVCRQCGAWVDTLDNLRSGHISMSAQHEDEHLAHYILFACLRGYRVRRRTHLDFGRTKVLYLKKMG